VREGTGISLGVAGVIVTFFTLLGALVVFLGYALVSVYAIVKLIGGREDHANPTVVIVGFVLLTSTLVAALLVGIRYLGGSLNERRPAVPVRV
jgi:hypothetical protein